MTDGATAEVRDRISAFLAGRGGFEVLAPLGAALIGWAPANPVSPFAAWVAVDGGHVRVERLNAGCALDHPADVPDLLERLGETLDRLGV